MFSYLESIRLYICTSTCFLFKKMLLTTFDLLLFITMLNLKTSFDTDSFIFLL